MGLLHCRPLHGIYRTPARARHWAARRLRGGSTQEPSLASCSTDSRSPLGQGPRFLGLCSQTSSWGATQSSCSWSMGGVVSPINTGGMCY